MNKQMKEKIKEVLGFHGVFDKDTVTDDIERELDNMKGEQ